MDGWSVKSITAQCEVCGSDAAHWATIHGYDHLRCARCKHLFVYPKPTQSDLDAFYADGGYYDDAKSKRDKLQKDARLRLDKLQRLCDRSELPRKILDVGCATGIFLSEAISKGWDAGGVEQSAKIASEARRATKATISIGSIESLTIPGAPFSVVTAWEVIEHSLSPRLFLTALARQVVPGGFIALSTPLINGLPALVMGRRFPMLAPPEHLSLFSKRSLTLMGTDLNLRLISYSSFSNLTAKSLASGLSQVLLRRKIDKVPSAIRGAFEAFCYSIAWAPKLVDLVGWGTEMQVIFQRLSR